MSNGILKFDITGEYQTIEQKLMKQYAQDRHCWIDLANVVHAEFFINQEGITFLADKKQFCPYNKIFCAKEMENGILLYMKKNQYFFMPVTSNKLYDEALISLSYYLNKQNIPYLRMGNLKGIRLHQKIHLIAQGSRGAYVGKSLWLPLAIAIISALCSIAFFIPLFQNYTIDREQAVKLNGTYSNFQEYFSRGTTRYIELHFKDIGSQEVDGCCAVNLTEKLAYVSSGTKIDLLLHPESRLVFEIKTEKEILLDFDMAQKAVRTEAIGFAFIALFMVVVFIGAVIYIKHNNTGDGSVC